MAIGKGDPIIFDQNYAVDENTDVSVTIDASISEGTVAQIGRLTDSISRLQARIDGRDATIASEQAEKLVYQQQIADAEADGVITKAEARLIAKAERNIDKCDSTIDRLIASNTADQAELDALQQDVDFLESEGGLSYAIVGGDPDGHFQIDANGVITTTDGLPFDFESGDPTSYDLVIAVTETDLDGTATTTEATVTIDVNDINEAPDAPTLTGSTSVLENDAGAVFGIVAATDQDAGDVVTLSVSDARFEIVGGVLKLKDGISLDYEAGATVSVDVTATDLAGLTTTTTFAIDVINVNEAPRAITLTNASVAENAAGAVISPVLVTDDDNPGTAFGSHTFTVSDSRFEIVDGVLKLKDGVSLDHEAGETVPVTVTATDGGGLSVTNTFTIVVGDVNEAPSAVTVVPVAGTTLEIDENAAGADIGTIVVSDPDALDTHTLTVSDTRFEIVDGMLKLKDGVSLDFEAEPTVTLNVTATDAGGLSNTSTVTVAVNDLPEGPLDISLATNTVAENLAGGVIGTVLLDGGAVSTDGYTFTVDDPRFEVVNGALKLVDGVDLDFESASSVAVQITATSPTGAVDTQSVAVAVTDVFESPTTIDATTSGDSMVFGGFTVSGAGDVNGDGFDDVMLSNPMAGGTTYVVFGSAAGVAPSFDATTVDGTTGFALTGVSVGDPFASYVSSAGDLNGDGFDDILVGAHAANGGAGAAYVVFGQAGGWTSSIDVSALDGSNGFRIGGGPAGAEIGYSVSDAGDVNGDGYDDLIVGANGTAGNAAYVVYGGAGGWSADLDVSTLDGTNGFSVMGQNGTAINGAFNYSVSAAGDVNGDGVDDLMIGAWVNDASGAGSGSAYVVYGDAAGLGTSVDLQTLDGTNGFRIDGVNPDDRLGYSVSSAGDINGDGIDDLLIGAIGVNPDGIAISGASYVVFGQEGGMPAGIDLSTLDGSNGFRLDGTGAEQAGFSVSSIGDMNGDGFDDLVVGATFADGSLGAAYVVFGSADGWTGDVDLANFSSDLGFEVVGLASNDFVGVTVSSAGDIDGDGFADLIVGAPAFTTGAYGDIVYGGDFTNSVTHAGTSANDVLAGGAAPDHMVAGQGDDQLYGGGGADVLYGGAGNDLLAVGDAGFQRLDGGSGYDTLSLDGGGVSLDLTTIGDATISGIEAIDLTGTGDNTLTLEVSDLLQLSDESNALFVSGDAGDSVAMVGGWSGAGTATLGGVDYNVFEVAGIDATLYIETDVAASVALIG